MVCTTWADVLWTLCGTGVTTFPEDVSPGSSRVGRAVISGSGGGSSLTRGSAVSFGVFETSMLTRCSLTATLS